MSDTIEVDPGAIDTMATQIALALEGMQTELDTLDSVLQTLGQQWSGEASDAYQTAQGQWLGSMEALRAWGERAVQALHAVSSEYTRAESAVIARCT